jgi:hypothetical protein
MRSKILLGASCAGLLLSLASCQTANQPGSLDPTLNAFFPEDAGDVRKTHQFADGMAASGARADATLSRHHFDGPRLNSLGQEKLALMLRDDDAPAPLRLFLNLPEADAVSKQRQAAVVTHLRDLGLTEDQVDVAYGANPDNWSPASKHAAGLSKTETGAAGAAVGGGALGAATSSDKDNNVTGTGGVPGGFGADGLTAHK